MDMMKWMRLLLILCAPIFAFGHVEDRYDWLEEMETSRTEKWVRDQNEVAENYLRQMPDREWIEDTLKQASDYDSYGLPVQRGKRLFFLMQGKDESLPSLILKEGDGSSRILVYASPGAPLSDFVVSEDGKIVTYAVSEAGSDRQVWKFLSVDSGEFLEDTIEGIQFSSPVWGFDQKGVYYISYAEKAIYYHELGKKSDTLLYKMEGESKTLLLALASPFENTLLFEAINGWSRDNAVYIFNFKSKKVEEIVPFGKGKYQYVGEVDGDPLFLTDQEAPRNKLVFYKEGWKEVVPESSFTLIEAAVVDGEIVCHYLDDCTSILKRFNTSGKYLGEIPVPGRGSVSLAANSPFFAYTDVVTPKTVHHFNGDVYFQPHCRMDMKGYVTEQMFFPSKDGTSISLFLTYEKGLKLTDRHLTLLYGYGGFNIPITPSYSALVATWLKKGGVFVSVNLRGGGEYGKDWHEAGKLSNKQNVFDDFIGAAEFLVKRGITSPSMLAINGRSNGGLLVGACLTQRPDLFGAAVPQVGVLDMLKFHQFTIGWTWMSDYGDPGNPTDFAYLYDYSPYHNIKDGVCYPPTLVTTADHDDRVVPLHSYKFAARLQEAQGCSFPILLRVYSNTGHGRGRSRNQIVEEGADVLSFLLAHLKP